VTRRTRPLGALALATLALAGCGAPGDTASVATTPPAAFVDAVRELVAPAERMGVVATSALSPEGPQAAQVEVTGLVADARRELREFRALRPGDPVLRAEQSRLSVAMARVIDRMARVRTILATESRTGLAGATTALLDALGEMPSAARS
jgi:hypothetical protein